MAVCLEHSRSVFITSFFYMKIADKTKNSHFLVQAISRGVPILTIPFFGDQHRNSVRAVRAGYAKMLDFRSITTESLVDAVNEMITNRSYADKMNEISSIYSDNLVHPMQEAMFWIEYVIRHKGAKFMKSHSIQMPYISYLLLDVLCVNLTVLLAFIITLLILLRRRLKSGENNSNTENQSMAGKQQ